MTTPRGSSLLLVVLLAGCTSAPSGQAPAEVVAVRRASVAEDPTAPAWAEIAAFRAPLQPQDMVEPRLLSPSTPEVWVKAMADGARIAFRLEWPDATRDDLPDTGRFSDACAVQLPHRTEADVPAPQMGEPGRPVEIAYWRAAWQAVVDGREDTIRAIHPGAVVDHYPFEAASLERDSPEQRAMANRYAPARALGNEMAGPRASPVQDLVAEGPGTLHPAGEARSEGKGKRGQTGWAVVVIRPLPEGLEPGRRTQVAFAVWDGARQEAGARKMRTAWLPLLREEGR